MISNEEELQIRNDTGRIEMWVNDNKRFNMEKIL